MLTRSSASASRVLDRLDLIYAIGGGAGANRPAHSREEQEACELAARWMQEAGLEVAWDGFGNLVGRLRGLRPELPEVWTGSHLDSVPSGGRFDGALGVVGGVEAVQRAGRGERTLAVAVFRAEETGCHGSRALVASGELPGCFVEAHVEQGPLLERAGAPLGVVTSIAAALREEREFLGRAAHAGTTPMDAREDALCAAAEFVLRVRDAAAAVDGAVATVGALEVRPGVSNVVPESVRLTVDARAPDRERLERLAGSLGLELPDDVAAVPMAEEPSRVLREEIERLGVPAVELPSGAGHDAGILASAGVSAGMLFVRSLNGGASHSPDELTAPEDVALAVDVLAGALRRLAAGARA